MISQLRIGLSATAPIYVGSARAGDGLLENDPRRKFPTTLKIAGPVSGELAVAAASDGEVEALGGSLRGGLTWPLRELPLKLEGPLAKLAWGNVTVQFHAEIRGKTPLQRRDRLSTSGTLLLRADGADSPRAEVEFSKKPTEKLLLQKIRVRIPGTGCLVGSGDVDLVQESINATLALEEGEGLLRWLAKGREYKLGRTLRDASLDQEAFLVLIPRAIGNILGAIPCLLLDRDNGCYPDSDT